METGVFISRHGDIITIKSVIEIDKNHADLLTDVINEVNDEIPVINKIEKDSKGNEKVFNIIIVEDRYMPFESILYSAVITGSFHRLIYKDCKNFINVLKKSDLKTYYK